MSISGNSGFLSTGLRIFKIWGFLSPGIGDFYSRDFLGIGIFRGLGFFRGMGHPTKKPPEKLKFFFAKALAKKLSHSFMKL